MLGLSAKVKKQGGAITKQDLLDELRKQGVDFEQEDENTIIIDGKYIYELEEKDGDVIPTPAGTMTNPKPKILSADIVDKTETSITLQVTVVRNGNGSLLYSIKEENGEYQEIARKKTTTSEATQDEYTFMINPNKIYVAIKVEAIAENGKTASKEVALSDLPILSEDGTKNITFNYNVNGKIIKEEDWTKGPVLVTVKLSSELKEYTLQYTTSDWTIESNWKEYPTGGISVRENGTIYFRLKDNTTGKTSIKYSKKITNIDTKAPNAFMPITNSTTNNITISGSTQDPGEAEGTVGSGIVNYYFGIEEGNGKPASWEPTWVPENGKTPVDGSNFNYEFKELKQNTVYSLRVKAVDKVGHETKSDIITVTTIKVLDAINKKDDISKGNVEFTYSNTELTNDDVRITVETELKDYTIQYAIGDPTDEKNWKDYEDTNPITMTENGNVYVRLKDKIGQVGDYATVNIDNIDKAPPKDFTSETLTSTYTWSSITVKASTTDQEKTNTNACSQIEGYRFKLDNGDWTEWQKGTTCEYTFEGLQPNIEYTIQVETKDKVGNVTKGTIKTIIRDTTPPVISNLGLTSTSRSITVTGTVVEEKSGIAKCEFSKDGGKTWVTPTPVTSNTYTFDELNQNTTFQIQMRVTDNAGNVSEIKSASKQTVGIPTLQESNIILSPDKSTPIDGTVNVTIQHSAGKNYRVQYTTKQNPTQESDWEDYTEGTKIPFEQNGVIHARLWDGKNAGGVATVNITNIDKLPPNPFTSSSLTATSTENSITVSASTTDATDANGYEGSGGIQYRFKLGNGNYTSYQTSGNYTFSAGTGYTLTKNTQYTITVQAKDRVGHTTEGTVTIRTKNMYTVTYNANGGTGAPSSQTKIEGRNLTLSSAKPTRNGYLFIGWSTSSNATTASYQPADNYSTNSDVTLYAVWKDCRIVASDGFSVEMIAPVHNGHATRSTFIIPAHSRVSVSARVAGSCKVSARFYVGTQEAWICEAENNSKSDVYVYESGDSPLEITISCNCEGASIGGKGGQATMEVTSIVDLITGESYILE